MLLFTIIIIIKEEKAKKDLLKINFNIKE